MDPGKLVGSSSSSPIVGAHAGARVISRTCAWSAALFGAALLVACASGHSPPPAATGPAPSAPPPTASVGPAPVSPTDTLSAEEARDLAALQAETFKGPVGSTNDDLDDEVERFLKEESDALLTETVDYDIPIVINERVEYFVDYFQNRVRNSFAKWLARAPQVTPYMRSRFRQEGLPEDLIYISLIESGFSPQATSHASAVGYWQFISGTARRYGLRVDRWVDERRDIEKSTEAAIAYLKDLHQMFGSWYLAAAAYNSGEGRIQKAIDKYGSENLWELAEFSYLRTETKDYVPKLIAATLIAKEPDKYGFGDIPGLPPVAVDTVTVPTPTDLRVIAAVAGTNLDTIRALNPKLRSYATPPGVGDFAVLVPRGSGSAFAERLAQVPPPKRLVERYHVVKRGDTPSRIAAKYGVTTSQLMAENGIRNPRALRVGQRLRLPGTGAGDDLELPLELAGAAGAGGVGAKSAAPAAAEPAPAGGTPVAAYAGQPPGSMGESAQVIRYRVRRGDNLFRIALAHGVTVEDMKRWNPSLGSRIYPGQTLVVQTPGEPSTGGEPEPVIARAGATSALAAGQSGAVTPAATEPAAAEPAGVTDAAAEPAGVTEAAAEPAGVTEQEVAAPISAAEPPANPPSSAATPADVASQQEAAADPGADPSSAEPAPEPRSSPVRHVVHEVQEGETVATIATLYDVSAEQIRLWNGLRGNAVREGERLVLFPGAPPPSR